MSLPSAAPMVPVILSVTFSPFVRNFDRKVEICAGSGIASNLTEVDIFQRNVLVDNVLFVIRNRLDDLDFAW